jgi:drug/metabolite transporter (DMT)-like permease
MVALKIAIRSADPLTVQALSTALTAVCLLGWAVARGADIRPGTAGVRAASLTAVPMTIGSSLGVAFGVQRVDAGLAAILISTTPIASLVIGRVLLHDPGDWRGVVGVLLGVAGVSVVSIDAVGATDNSDLLGIGLVLVGALGWALGMAGMKLAHGSLPPAVLVGWQMALGAPVLLVIAWVVTGMSSSWSIGFVLALAYGGLLAKGFSFLLQVWTVSRASILATSSTAFLVPVSGTVTGVVLLGESIQARTVAGALVILAGVAFVVRDGRRGVASIPAVER